MEPSRHVKAERTAEAPLWQHFVETLPVCSRQIDAFHLALQTALKLGVGKAAVCVADPAWEERLVVRLSVGMEDASNKVLAASRPGPIAALEAFTREEALVVPDFALSHYNPTDLEERQGITGAAYFPIHPSRKGAMGLLVAVPSAHAPFNDTALRLLNAMATALGENLERLTVAKPVGDSIAAAEHVSPALFKAFSLCLNTPNIEELADQTLKQCCNFTGSDFGFVGYLEPATGFLACPTMTRIFAQCKVEGKTEVFQRVGGLVGWVLEHKTPLMANDPTAHPASVGTPSGHLPIRKYLGVPCFSQGTLVGMISLANKDEDYTPQDLRIVSAFADIYAAAISRFFSERELTESRNRLSSLYHEAPCGYDTLSPDGTIVEINDTALKLLGRSREEVIGKINIHDLLTTTGKALLAEQMGDIKRGHPAAPVELYLRQPDETRLPTLHSMSADVDERGCLKDMRCTLVDVGLRKVLRETRDYLEALFKDSASPIVVWNPQLQITRFNDAFERLSGYGCDAVIGHHLGMLFPENERDALLEKIKTTVEGTRLESAELPIQTASGERKTLLWNSSNLYSEDGSQLLATVVQGVDITERKEYELALRKTNRALKTLSRGNEALVHAVDEAGLLQQVCEILVSMGGYHLAWIGYAEHDAQKTIRPVARAGRAADYVDQIKVTWDDSPTGRGPGGMAIRTRTAQVFQDILNDPRFLPWRAEALKRGYASNAAFPLYHDDQTLGVLALYGERPNAFDADEVQLVTELASDLAFGITTLRTRAEHSAFEKEREHHLQHLKESMEAAVQAIAATIEKRDPYTAGHQQRVARLAVAIATEMGLSPQQIEGIRFGGLIHDIGKISVPAEILSKPGLLAPVEFQLIQAHAASGREILNGVKFPWPILDMVYQHHERLNGSGYPQGLKDEAIQFEARIIAVADVVEAMSSFRPYRPALGIKTAMEEIAAQSGRLYDPVAVAACLKVLREGFAFDA